MSLDNPAVSENSDGDPGFLRAYAVIRVQRSCPVVSHSETAISSLESASSTQQELKAKFGDLDFAARKIAPNGLLKKALRMRVTESHYFGCGSPLGVITSKQGKDQVVAGVTDLS
jgi:hypothetical protein